MIDSEVKNFLEHHGVKGQRWGIRNKRSLGQKLNSSSFGKVAQANVNSHNRNPKPRQKLVAGLFGAGAGFIGARIVSRATLNTPMSLIAGGASATLGYKIMKQLLEKDHASTQSYMTRHNIK